MSQTSIDGHFTMSVPLACECMIYAYSGQPWVRPGTQSPMTFGKAKIRIGPNGPRHLRVVTRPGATVHGRIVGPSIRDYSKLRVTSIPFGADQLAAGVLASAAVTPDGRFELLNVFGRVTLDVATPADMGLWLDSIILDGTDITDTGFELSAAHQNMPVLVALASPSMSVRGTVTDGDQQVEDAAVVLFSSDARRWHHPADRYVKVTRSAENGDFRFVNVPDGEYQIVAVSTVAVADVADPAFLSRLRRNALTVYIRQGDTTTVELTLLDNVNTMRAVDARLAKYHSARGVE
jgi:hypothetical protein